MSAIRCPICEAEPGEPCYDPHGDLPHKGKHHGRFEAEQEAALKHKLAQRDAAYYERRIAEITAEIATLAKLRAGYSKNLREIQSAD